jgi:hypothetical protein
MQQIRDRSATELQQHPLGLPSGGGYAELEAPGGLQLCCSSVACRRSKRRLEEGCSSVAALLQLLHVGGSRGARRRVGGARRTSSDTFSGQE